MIIYKTGIFTHSPQKNLLVFHRKHLVSLIVVKPIVLKLHRLVILTSFSTFEVKLLLGWFSSVRNPVC